MSVTICHQAQSKLNRRDWNAGIFLVDEVKGIHYEDNRKYISPVFIKASPFAAGSFKVFASAAQCGFTVQASLAVIEFTE